MPRIKVAYLECNSPHEDYACFPKMYSGCSIFARWAKEIYNSGLHESNIDFYIFAPESCFDSVKVNVENSESCIPISMEDFLDIKSGKNLKKTIPDKFDSFDIIMHNNPNLLVDLDGLKAKQIIWGPYGTVSEVTEKAEHVLYWRKNEKPKYSSQNIYKIQLGKPVAETYVEPEKKSDFIFQCTRHDRQTNTMEVIHQCKKNKIDFIFGGPVMEDSLGIPYPGIDRKWYPCLLNVKGGVGDNCDYVKYIGNTVSEEEKLNLCQESRLTTYLFERNPSFNLSVIESLSVGTPILAPKKLLPERTPLEIMPNNTEIIEDDQFFRSVIVEGETGFYYDGDNFLDCYEAAAEVDPEKCWEMARNFSLDKMIDSFTEAIENVMDTK